LNYLTEAHRLRILDNRILKKILGPKRKEVKGSWKKKS
jgi:hypothetical protein